MRVLSLVCVLSLAGFASADSSPKAAFDQLKSLVGTWKGKAAGDDCTVDYKLTGNGSALIETQFPGTGHEMVTMYHLDGKDLIMTHYCAAGNQPTMRYVPGKDPKVMQFVFLRGTNMKPADMHMHSVKIEFLGKDRMNGYWSNYRDGKPLASLKFEMSRAKA